MIQNENSRIAQVKLRFIREYNIKVLDEWLSGCVSFCLQENPKTSNESLFQFAFSQWLLADLNDVGVGVLPPGLDGKTEAHTLTGSFPVQMQYLIDMSEPAYEQWRTLYDKRLDEADDEVQMRRSQAPHTKKRRMLKLEVTDGKQTILAMEHSPIRSLSTKLAAGIKLLLTGPMRCINRVLFLEPKNVRVLGGEVDVLLITNAYENILLRALNKPPNPNPKIEYEEVDVVEMKHRPGYSNIQPISMAHDLAKRDAKRKDEYGGTKQKSPQLVTDDVDDDSLLLGIDLEAVEASQPPHVASKPEQVASISTLMDDDEMDDFVQQVVLPEEPEIMHHQVSSTKLSQSSPKCVVSTTARPSYDDPFEDDINMMNSLEDQIRHELREFDQEPPPEYNAPDEPHETRSKVKKMRTDADTPMHQSPKQSVQQQPSLIGGSRQPNSPQRPTHVQPSSSSKMFNCFNASSLFEDSIDAMDMRGDLADDSTSPNILSPKYAFRIAGSNLVTIEQLMALTEQDRAGASFVVYSEVSGVSEQPRIRKERWHLAVQLTDHSEELLSVRLHNDVIAKMARHDAGELMRMHKTDREGVMRLLNRILADFKELLQEIKCFWSVLYPAAGTSELPIVMETFEMDDERGAILLDKIIKENCSQLRKML